VVFEELLVKAVLFEEYFRFSSWLFAGNCSRKRHEWNCVSGRNGGRV